jgi:uncharacterized membrane protein
MKRLANYFLQGLLFLVPMVLTVYAFVWSFRFVDRLLGLSIPGLGLLITVVTIVAVGFLASNFLTRRFLAYLERFFARVPIARFLYSSVKDLMGAFVGEKRRFDRPVVVDLLPGAGIRCLGFVTRDSLEAWNMHDCASVYFPQTYNFAGYMAIIPKDRIQPIAVDGAECMAFIVSGGITGYPGVETAKMAKA